MRLKGVLQPLRDDSTLNEIITSINNKRYPININGLSDSGKSYGIFGIYESIDSPMIILTHSDMEAKNIYEDLSFYTNDIYYFPAKEVVFYNIDAISGDLRWARLKVIKEILDNKNKIIVEEEKGRLDKLNKENKAKVKKLIKLQGELSSQIKLTEKEISELESRGQEINNEIVSSSGGGSYNGSKMAWPVIGYTTLSSKFGYRIHPISGEKKLHTGIDIPAPAGTPVVAANSGTVIISRYDNSYGNMVAIDHGGGIVSFYAHNTERLVKVGDKVSKGQKISTVGTTGYSTGNHLHFEVKKNGTFVDPMNYL